MSINLSPEERELAELRTWIQTELPEATVEHQREVVRRDTILQVTLPAQVTSVAITDTQMAAHYPECITDAAVSLVEEARAKVIAAAGIQALIDNAREEGMTIVAEFIEWMSVQIKAAEEEALDLESLPEARANLLGAKRGMASARRQLATVAGIEL